jgi:hypothetical protein
MRRSSNRSASRDAENTLYEAGCELVEAAAGIARGAAQPGAVAAVPAVLGCIATALDDLNLACSSLQCANNTLASDPTPAAATDRLDRGYADLSVALQHASHASRAARSLAAHNVTDSRRT